MFNLIKDSITSSSNTLNEKICHLFDKLNNSRSIVKTTADNALLLAQDNKKLYDELSSKIDHLSNELKFALSESDRQHDHMLKNYVIAVVII